MAQEETLKIVIDPMARNPQSIPEWRSIYRECELVRELIGAGATALGKANYADGIGHYYNAFFGLSTGIERLAKLILVADHIMHNNGVLPDEKIIQSYRRKYGHDLIKLLDVVESIAKKNNLKLTSPRPCNAISKSIVDCLNSFADASKGRYFNFNFNAVDDSNSDNTDEPIKKWWCEVAEPILKDHYIGTAIEEKVKQDIIKASNPNNDTAFFIFYIDETGGIIQDLPSCLERAGQTEIVQKFGRYYTLQIVRWIAEVFFIISRDSTFPYKFELLSGHYEHFQTFLTSDNILLTQEKWP